MSVRNTNSVDEQTVGTVSMKAQVKEIISTVLRVILGLVFCASAILKLVSINDFEIYLTSLGLFGFDVASLLGRLLIIAELILGVAIISGWWQRLVYSLTIVVLVVFSAFLLWRIAVGDEESCHCFGTLVEMNPIQSMLKNLLAVCVITYLCFSKSIDFFGQLKYKIYVAVAFSVVALAVIMVINPPDFFLRMTKRVSSDVNVEELAKYTDDTPINEGRHLVFFYSPVCPHCCHCAAKMEAIINYHGIPKESCYAFFMQTVNEMDDAVSEFWQRCAGVGNLSGAQQDDADESADEDSVSSEAESPYAYKYIHPYLFIPITNGNIPIVCLFEDGKLVKEYDVFTIDEREITDFLLPR